MATTAFCQDLAIWRTKGLAINILRLPGDGPFHRGRAWYCQFYNPRAQAADFQARADGSHASQGLPIRPLAAE